MSRFRLLSAALLAAGLPLAAFASPTHGEASFTGPLVTPAVNTLPAGTLNVEPYLTHTSERGYYENDGGRHRERPIYRSWGIALPAIYGVTDSLSVQLTLTGTRVSGGGLHSDGLRLGDSTVSLLQRLKAPEADGSGLVVAVSLAQRLATGRYDETENNPLNGIGSGANRTSLAVGAQQLHWLANGHALRWRSRVAWSPAPPRVRLHSESVYGTNQGFDGSAHAGQAWSASFATEYVLDARWVLVGEAIWNRSGRTTITDNHANPTRTAFRHPSSHDISLAPAVEYHVSPTMGLIAGVQFTVAGRNRADYVAPQVALNMVF